MSKTPLTVLDDYVDYGPYFANIVHDKLNKTILVLISLTRIVNLIWYIQGDPKKMPHFMLHL